MPKKKHRGKDPFPARRRAPNTPHAEAARVSMAEARSAQNEKAEALASFEAMVASRPLKPPPMPATVDRTTAGARALRRDIKLGAYSRASGTGLKHF